MSSVFRLHRQCFYNYFTFIFILMCINSRTVTRVLNDSFMDLFAYDANGNKRPFVCCVCDEFVKTADRDYVRPHWFQSEKRHELLRPPDGLPDSLRNCYVLDLNEQMRDDDPMKNDAFLSQITALMLSPRATFVRDSSFSKWNCKITACRSCRYTIQNNVLPDFAIKNGNYVGSPPACLLDLSEVEVAYLSPVKTFGYLFAYTGGKVLEGSLSFFKVQQKSIVRGVTQLDVIGLNHDVVTVFYGNMSQSQLNRARRKSTLRVTHVMRAVEWLLTFNSKWTRLCVDMDRLRHELLQIRPIFIDNSAVVENDAPNNIEDNETFRVFFPDGTLDEETGGQGDVDKFKEIISAVRENGFQIDYQCSFAKESVADFKDDNFVNSSILQFPYGRGGMDEERERDGGGKTHTVDVDEYIRHLSMLSQEHFHYDKFVLILYNMTMKRCMVKTATWRVRGKLTASDLSNNLTQTNVDYAINRRKRGIRQPNGASGSFLKAIDGVAGSIPHSNEATKRARREAEAICHRFGSPNLFLTVTPDDETSVFVMIHTRKQAEFDLSLDAKDSDIEDVQNEWRKRHKLRITYPGVCAYFFDAVLETILREIVGWDTETNAAKREGGLFGRPSAYTVSVEEQGRGTLHAHILIWIKKLATWQRDSSVGVVLAAKAKRKIAQFVSETTTTSFLARYRHGNERVRFFHKCVDDKIRDCKPEVVNDQSLRNLRNRRARMHFGGAVAYCPKCSRVWTQDTIVEEFLIGKKIFPAQATYPGDINRLKLVMLQYQQDDKIKIVDRIVPDAAWNIHRHSTGCFTKKKRKTSSKCDEEYPDECRYRMPKRRRSNTVVVNATDAPIKWHRWTGEAGERHVHEVIHRRHELDGFVNESVPSITESKLGCNTNISVVFPGPIAGYSFKYQMKDTQKDDVAQYERISETTQRILSMDRKYDSDFSEAVRRVLAASFAQQKKGIVGSAMAAFLTRAGTRFRLSHKSVWIPMKDAYDLLIGGGASAMVNQFRQTSFFVCSALHYLCRPAALETVNMKDFFTQYEVIRCTAKNRESLMKFINTPDFKHPSYKEKKKHFLQGVRTREGQDEILPKIYERMFPDTSTFDGQNILDNTVEPKECHEKYAKAALLLLQPFRDLGDLQREGSFTKRFRYEVAVGGINREEQEYLQNIQDTAHNVWRAKNLKDDLERCTTLLGKHEFDISLFPEPEEEEQRGELTDFEEVKHLLTSFEEEFDEDYLTSPTVVPYSYDPDRIKNIGTHNAGYAGISKRNFPDRESSSFVTEDSPSGVNSQQTNESNSQNAAVREKPRQQDLLYLLIHKTDRKTKTFSDITGKDDASVLQANGSAKSVIDWGEKSGIDKWQRRAFEVMTSYYLLTYHKALRNDTRLSASQISELKREKLRLMKLGGVLQAGRRHQHQLIALLHGPGGSGKTAVIDLLLAYAKEYCSLFDNPDYAFDSQTIVVTALTGVAASMLDGETVHSKLHLNARARIPAENIELWESTRMVIIDEISFCDKQTMHKINKNLCVLRQTQFPFGGLNIVFSGDFRQLEPVTKGSKALYDENCPTFRDQINCYIELKGMHRFKDDPSFGELLMRIRDGTYDATDIDKLNERVHSPSQELPKGLRYATYMNKDRDAINEAIFDGRAQDSFLVHGHSSDSIMIFADELEVRVGQRTHRPFRTPNVFWKNCSESKLHVGKNESRVDPVLKLYEGCPVMLQKNIDVKRGLANGTRAKVKQVILRKNQQTHDVFYGGVKVRGILASQVDKILLTSEKNGAEISLNPRKFTFLAEIPLPNHLRVGDVDAEHLRMKATQLPILVNNATTGHKLQGATVDKLFVHSWRYEKNWPYVVLSRVKRLDGLFLRQPLTYDKNKFAVPAGYTRLLRHLEKHQPQYLSEREYQQILAA